MMRIPCHEAYVDNDMDCVDVSCTVRERWLYTFVCCEDPSIENIGCPEEQSLPVMPSDSVVA